MHDSRLFDVVQNRLGWRGIRLCGQDWNVARSGLAMQIGELFGGAGARGSVARTHTHMHACMQCLLQETYIGQEVSGPRTRATDFVGVETGSCATVSSVALSDGVHILGHGQILTLSMTSNILYHIYLLRRSRPACLGPI